MTGKERITKALEQVWAKGRVTASNIYRGFNYDGAIEATGWWVVPFNEQAIFLGTSIAEALDTIDNFGEN